MSVVPNAMPRISVVFQNAAETVVSRSSRGIVAVILRDAAAVGPLELRSASAIPTKLTADNQSYLRRAFLGSPAGRVQKVLVYVLGASETDFSAAYAWLATQRFSWLCLPPDATSEMCDACKTWLMAQRSENSAIYKAVLPNFAADNERFVNFTTGGIKVGTGTYDAAQYCSRIAGVLASTPITQSVTYTVLSEVEDVERLTATAMDEAVAAGKLLAFYDGQQVRLGTGVNSMTTLGEGQTADLKKILIVDTRDMIEEDLRRLCADDCIGKLRNTYDGRLSILLAVKTYFSELETQTVIQPDWTAELDADASRQYLEECGIDTSEMTDEQVLKSDLGTWVFIRVSVRILDAVENITIAVYRPSAAAA